MRLSVIKAALVVGVAVLLFVAKAIYDHGVRDRALRDAEYKAAVGQAREYKRQVDSLVFQLDRRVAAFEALDSAYERKTIQWRIQRVTDTTWLPAVPETVTVETVREIVKSADATINSCRLTVDTCLHLQAQKDSLIEAKDRMIASMPKPTPGWKRWGERVVIATLAFKLGRM